MASGRSKGAKKGFIVAITLDGQRYPFPVALMYVGVWRLEGQRPCQRSPRDSVSPSSCESLVSVFFQSFDAEPSFDPI